MPIIYTDGSYDQARGLSGYGYVVCIGDDVFFQDGGIIWDSDIINLKSLGSEMFALLRAMEWSLTNGYKEVIVVYDSKGVLSLISSTKKTKAKNSKGKTKFISVYKKYAEFLTVHFEHRSVNKQYEYYHMYAHNLSRMAVNLFIP